MKNFIIDNDQLKKVLKKTGLAIHPKPTLPVISNLLVKVKNDKATFVATDLELTIVFSADCKATEEFDVLLPFDFLNKIASLHGSIPLTIEIKGTMAFVKGANDTYEMKLGKLKDYPAIPEVPADNKIELNASVIDWLSRATATTGTGDVKPAIKKVCLDITPGLLKIVSTDTFVIFTHKHVIETQYSGRMLISTKIASALDGFAVANLSFNENHISFAGDGITVIATKFNEKYPRYEPFFIECEKSVTLSRLLLIDALKKNSITNNKMKISTIKLKQSAEKLVFEAQDDEDKYKIAAEVPGEYTGAVEQLSINAKQLLTLLGQVDNFETVNLHITAADKVLLLSADEDTNYLALLSSYNK